MAAQGSKRTNKDTQNANKTSNAEQETTIQNDAKGTITDEQVDLVVKEKRHRNRPDLQNFGAEHVDPGDNARYIRFAMASWNLPPIDISDPKQVEQRITEYFSFCAQNDRKPNIKGLGNWLGVDATTVNSWRRGEYRAETHSPLIRKAVDMLEEMWWDYGQNGKVNPANWIFIGKNAFGMKDEQNIVVRPEDPLGDKKTHAQLEEEYSTIDDE